MNYTFKKKRNIGYISLNKDILKVNNNNFKFNNDFKMGFARDSPHSVLLGYPKLT